MLGIKKSEPAVKNGTQLRPQVAAKFTRLGKNNTAPRHHRQAAKMKAAGIKPLSLVDTYVILSPNHKPDLRGEFAGQKVFKSGGNQCVRLTPAQARFYLASGSIRKLETAQAKK